MSPRVVLVGAGGVAAPLAMVLVAGGLSALVLVDDDFVETSNLHRQILFDDADVGLPKTERLAAALVARRPGLRVSIEARRATPETAAEIVAGATIVVDGTDNFASRFLLADACFLAHVPLVHAAAVRYVATVTSIGPAGRPCYRCLFEDLPEGPAPDCASAGVAGPVCGVAGAIAADRVLRLLAGDSAVLGTLVTYDGRSDRLREVPLFPRRDCALCGEAPTVRELDGARYDSAAAPSSARGNTSTSCLPSQGGRG